MAKVAERMDEIGGASQGGIVEGRRFRRKRVLLGGAGFVNCRFENCELVYDGQPVHLENNVFDACHWVFEGAAANTLMILQMLCAHDPAFAEQMLGELGLTPAPFH